MATSSRALVEHEEVMHPESNLQAFVQGWLGVRLQNDGVKHVDFRIGAGDGQLYTIPAGVSIPSESIIHVLPMAHRRVYRIKGFPLSNARQRIADKARELHVRGVVARVQAPDPAPPGETELRLVMEALTEEPLNRLVSAIEHWLANRASSEFAMALLPADDRARYVDLRAWSFHVKASGPKREDGEDSMEGASEVSYSVFSPRQGSQDAGLRIDLR